MPSPFFWVRWTAWYSYKLSRRGNHRSLFLKMLRKDPSRTFFAAFLSCPRPLFAGLWTRETPFERRRPREKNLEPRSRSWGPLPVVVGRFRDGKLSNSLEGLERRVWRRGERFRNWSLALRGSVAPSSFLIWSAKNNFGAVCKKIGEKSCVCF